MDAKLFKHAVVGEAVGESTIGQADKGRVADEGVGVVRDNPADDSASRGRDVEKNFSLLFGPFFNRCF